MKMCHFAHTDNKKYIFSINIEYYKDLVKRRPDIDFILVIGAVQSWVKEQGGTEYFLVPSRDDGRVYAFFFLNTLLENIKNPTDEMYIWWLEKWRLGALAGDELGQAS